MRALYHYQCGSTKLCIEQQWRDRLGALVVVLIVAQRLRVKPVS
jgi:hypothetical protein